jgi:hypothetical protein
MDSNGDSN